MGEIETDTDYNFVYYIINTNDTPNCFTAESINVVGWWRQWIPSHWITLTPSNFCLPARTSQRIEGTLRVPSEDNPSGDYRTIIAGCMTVGLGGICAGWNIVFNI